MFRRSVEGLVVRAPGFSAPLRRPRRFEGAQAFWLLDVQYSLLGIPSEHCVTSTTGPSSCPLRLDHVTPAEPAWRACRVNR